MISASDFFCELDDRQGPLAVLLIDPGGALHFNLHKAYRWGVWKLTGFPCPHCTPWSCLLLFLACPSPNCMAPARPRGGKNDASANSRAGTGAASARGTPTAGDAEGGVLVPLRPRRLILAKLHWGMSHGLEGLRSMMCFTVVCVRLWWMTLQ